MASQSGIQFGYMKYSTMLKYIEEGTLPAYSVCFTKDTNCQYIINSNKEPVLIKTKVGIYSSVSDANTKINQDSSTYNGELISIYNDASKTFSGYIINTDTLGKKYVTAINSDATIDYNSLINAPIQNEGTDVLNPVALTSLEDGIYKVNYFIAPDGIVVESIIGNFVFIQTLNGVKYITRITQKEIIKYTITEEQVSTEQYITDKYLSDNNYTTTGKVATQIEAYGYITMEQCKKYVEESVELLVKHCVQEYIEENQATDEDIKNLFND